LHSNFNGKNLKKYFNFLYFLAYNLSLKMGLLFNMKSTWLISTGRRNRFLGAIIKPGPLGRISHFFVETNPLPHIMPTLINSIIKYFH